jgi:hypothetical protein
MGKHKEFLKGRKYYLNVSQRTIEWHQQALRWLGVEEPTEKQLKEWVIRMRFRQWAGLGLMGASTGKREF